MATTTITTFTPPTDTYNTELVTCSAPRWAWDTINETLAMDAESKAFSQELRDEIAAAIDAMIAACETDTLCDECRQPIPDGEVMSCPDGAEICRRCFDAGAH